MLAGHSSNTDRYLKSNLKFQKGSSNPVPPLSKNQGIFSFLNLYVSRWSTVNWKWYANSVNTS